ncbi:hypothetical protein BOH76_17495 [Escherichia coli]|nr:hypothetical protein BOH76_17495 [Escherichia coli]
MTIIKQSCYKHYQEKHIMRKSYEVGISPKINLCNSVEVLTNSFGTVISGRQV